MTAADIYSSPFTINNSSYIGESSCSNGSCTITSCESYHRDLETQHAKIYRYNPFDELVIHLQTTLLSNLPYINYPSDQVMSLVLTGTQLSQAEDLVLNKTINLSTICTKYLHSLLSIFDHLDIKQEDEVYMVILKEELNNLYQRLSAMFKFLEPETVKRGRRKKQTIKANTTVLSVDSSTIEDSDEDLHSRSTSNLDNNRIESLFEVSTTSEKVSDSTSLYGLPQLKDIEKNMWSYIVYSFKISSKLCDIERLDTFLMYKETSSRWLEFIKILLRYLKLDLARNSDVSETLLGQNLLKISRCSNFRDASTYQLTDILLTLSSYVFTNLNTTLELTQILPIDLTFTNPSQICSALTVFKDNTNIKRLDIESIPMRYELLQLVWQICQLSHLPSIVKFKFINSVAVHMNNLNPLELATYYECFSQGMTSSILFPVSFEIMRLMFKAWTVTSENYATDVNCYVLQLQKLYQFIQVTDTDCSLQEDICMLNDINTGAKKFAVLAKFQLSAVMTTITFNDAELKLLKELVISIENKEVPLDLLLIQNNV